MTSRPYRLWLLAFGAFFLMIGAWAVAMPYDGAADEHEHIYRAAGVASGEVAPDPTQAVRGSGAFQTVPRGLIRPWPADSAGGVPTWQTVTPCFVNHPNLSAACAQPPSADRTPVRVGSAAGRYHPVYYAVVGWPLKLWPGWSGVLIARLLAAALAAALLAGAVVVIIRYTRHRLMLAGLLASVTPTGLHFMGSVNPNGLEIAAAIAFMAAAIPLALGQLDAGRVDAGRVHVAGHPRGPLLLAGVSAAWLAMLRPTGLVYLAAVFVALFLPLRAGNGRALLRVPAARWWAAAVGAAVVTTGIWIVTMQATNLGTTFAKERRYTGGEALLAVGEQWGDWTRQAIGLFSWYDVRLLEPAYLVWELAAGALLIIAIAVGGRVDRWRLLVLLAGGALVPTAIQVYYLNDFGFITQGRYLLPALCGLMLLSAYVIEERGLGAAQCRSLARLFVLLLVPIQVFALVLAMVRWQRGLPGEFGVRYLNPLAGDWHPVLGSATPVLALVCGVALLGWLVGQLRPTEPGAPVVPQPRATASEPADGTPADAGSRLS